MSEFRGFPELRDDRVLREFDQVKAEIDNALMSCNLQISRAEADLTRAMKRKRQLLDRLECLQAVSQALYWQRVITWATTGRVI